MAHTFDTATQYPSGYTAAGVTSNPVSFYVNPGDNCTLLVLGVPYAGVASRGGNPPTVNGITMTQVRTHATAGEATMEVWCAVASHFASVLNSATIPGSLTINIPNPNGRTMWGAALTYRAGAGKVSVLDVSTYKGGTGLTANPSGTLYPSAGANVCIMFDTNGGTSRPTSCGVNITSRFSTDPGAYTWGGFDRMNTLVGSSHFNLTAGSDDWSWVQVAFIEADAPIYAVTNLRSVGEQLGLYDFDDTLNNYALGVSDWMDTLADSTGMQHSVAAKWTDMLPTFDGPAGAERERGRAALDLLGLLDSAVREYVQAIVEVITTWPITDTLDVADSRARQVRLTRAVVEWLSLTDDRRQAKGAWKTIADALGLTDQEKHWALRGLATLDALFVFDATSRQIVVRRSEADVASLSDVIQRTARRTILVSDAMLLLADSHLRSRLQSTAAQDALPLYDGDFGVLELRHESSVLDGLVLSDSVVRQFIHEAVQETYSYALTDVLPLSDAAAKQAALSRAVLDWLLLDDGQRRQRSAFRAIVDALGLTDVQAQTLSRSLLRLDALLVYDTVTRELRLRRAAAETLWIYDQTQRQRAARIVQTETLILTDQEKHHLVRQQRMDDVLPLSDARAASAERIVKALDTLLVADQVTQLAHAFRRVVDTLAPLADSIVVEGATAGRIYTVQATDTLSVEDNSGARYARTRSVLDALAVGDTTAAAHALLRQAADALGIADLRSAALVIQRAAVDYTLLTDSRARRWWHAEVLTDRLGLTDAQVQARKLTLFESLVLSDAATATYIRVTEAQILQRLVTDVLTLADQAFPTRGRTQILLDLLGITDRAPRQLVARLITDVLEVVDRLRADRHFHVRESTAIADSVARTALLARATSDALALADSSAAERDRGWSAADILVLEDRLTRAIDLVLTDALPVSDALSRLWFQAVITLLTGIRDGISRFLGTKTGIINPLARWESRAVPYWRRIAVTDVNAARW
jgi:hypothetical protein